MYIEKRGKQIANAANRLGRIAIIAIFLVVKPFYLSNMNIYNFFNSPDVAEYCQSIGHTFNALESAVMVSQSNARTLAEKHEAYRTIIAEYPDMEIPEAFNHEHIKSFSKALKDVIEFERQLLEKFLLLEQNAISQDCFAMAILAI